MKRIIIPVFILIFSISLLYGCCSCGKTVAEGNTLKGIITAFGNEPFVEIGIKTEDNTNYEFICSKELKTELLTRQGAFYEIQFSEQKIENGIRKLVIEKVVQIKKNN